MPSLHLSDNTKQAAGNNTGNFQTPAWTQARLTRVSHRHPCPICEHTDWCSVSDDGRAAFCMRVSHGAHKVCRNGAYLHWLRPFEPSDQTPRSIFPGLPPKPPPAQPCAPLKTCHAIYEAWLAALSLSAKHHRDLQTRGLSNDAIAGNGYATTLRPNQAAPIIANLPIAAGVPGFYRDGQEWRTVWTAPGFFVPYRNANGDIQGLQYRLDDPRDGAKYLWFSSGPDREGKPRLAGASSGAPLHIAGRDLLPMSDCLLLTEGALKADIITGCLRVPVMAAAGVTQFGEGFAAKLRQRLPHIRQTVLAFDADYRTNKQVRAAFDRLRSELRAAGFAVSVTIWAADVGKGFDDVLNAPREEGRAV